LKAKVEKTRLITLGNAESYGLMTSAQMYAEKAPAMLIEGLLPSESVAGLTSYPGVGKSWLALELMRAVNMGDLALGHFQARHGGTLFVGNDSSTFDYARQWKRLTRKYPGEDFEGARFLLQSGFLFENDDEIRKLIKTHEAFRWGDVETEYDRVPEYDDDGNVTGWTEEPISAERKQGFTLIVFDTLTKLTRARENDNTEMNRVFANIRLIAELTGATVLLLHHNSKPTEYNDGTDWRGAVSQIGALDTWLDLTTRKKDKYSIRGTFKKYRGITPPDFEYRMNVSDVTTASLEFKAEVKGFFVQDEVTEEIARVVGEVPEGRSRGEIVDLLWPLFEGRFTTKEKFASAINNRINDQKRTGALTVLGKKGSYRFKPGV
jgi:hypothetical protein